MVLPVVVVHHIFVAPLHILGGAISIHFVIIHIPVGVAGGRIIELSGLLGHDGVDRGEVRKVGEVGPVGKGVIGVEAHGHLVDGHLVDGAEVAHGVDAAHAVGVVGVLRPVVLAGHVHAGEHLRHEVLVDLEHFPLEHFDLFHRLQVRHIHEHIHHIHIHILVRTHVMRIYVISAHHRLHWHYFSLLPSLIKLLKYCP